MANELFDKLEDMGAEAEDTLERLMGDEELYRNICGSCLKIKILLNCEKL